MKSSAKLWGVLAGVLLLIAVAGAALVPNRQVPISCPAGTTCDPTEEETTDEREGLRLAILGGGVASSAVFYGLALKGRRNTEQQSASAEAT